MYNVIQNFNKMADYCNSFCFLKGVSHLIKVLTSTVKARLKSVVPGIADVVRPPWGVALATCIQQQHPWQAHAMYLVQRQVTPPLIRVAGGLRLLLPAVLLAKPTWHAAALHTPSPVVHIVLAKRTLSLQS